MAGTTNIEAAREALRRRFGERLRADRDAGRQQLVEALAQDLGVSRQEAERVVDELEGDGTIRWVEGEARTMSSDESLMGSAFGAQGLPPAAASGLTHVEGYWQL